VIYQSHPAFRALYTGSNSLRPVREHATSTVETVYSGLRLGKRAEVFVDVESAGGRGISDAFGLAGFTDLDVVRNPSLGAAPYVARAFVRYTIGLTSDTETHQPELHALLPALPARRVSILAGKIGIVDFFDFNSAGSDSHLQFLNWTVDNNGAYDYAADTRGYTIGVVTEFRDHAWAARWGEALMPKVANGIEYDWDVAHEHADNFEIELDRGIIPHHDGAVRLLAYLNHARMGSYREAIDAFLSGRDSVLDVTAHRQRGRTKPGVGLNVEQNIGHGLTLFGRTGVNDGRVESFAYTEVDRTFEIGLGWTALPWRSADRIGAALVRNGLAADHREYLARGGHGFLLGDGALAYTPESIVEGYYTFAVRFGVSLAFDVQHITNPGYNRDRGPVTVFALRGHLDVPGPP
jgi:high affinity Mn2+ porin